MLIVFGRVGYLIWKYDFRTSMIWFVKLATDPITDIFAYFPRMPGSLELSDDISDEITDDISESTEAAK
jgi:hypothetical protein